MEGWARSAHAEMKNEYRIIIGNPGDRTSLERHDYMKG
jgi:hypothetical protein